MLLCLEMTLERTQGIKTSFNTHAERLHLDIHQARGGGFGKFELVIGFQTF